MLRQDFLVSLGAVTLLATLGIRPANATTLAVGDRTTLDALLSSMPVPPRSWVQHVMGAGVTYSKRIGVGHEQSRLGKLPFIETEIGDAMASCNPNTIKKAYLAHPSYGVLLAPHDVQAYIVKAGTAFSLLPTDASDKLYLLDEDNLYTKAPARIVALGSDPVRIHRRILDAQRVDLAFTPHGTDSLREMSLWLSPHVPFGIAKMHAKLVASDPFDLHVDTFGELYLPVVPDTLDEMRAQGV